MALTVERALRHVKHALRRSLSDEISGFEILNAAGAHLVTMYDWSWLERGAASLDEVASQDYLTLPTDFLAPIGIQAAELNRAFCWTSLRELLDLRRGNVLNGMTTYGAIVYNTSVAPQIQVYPTPTANATGVYSLFYQATWAQLLTDTETIPVPRHVENLFLEVARAFAMGWEKTTVTQELEMVAQGAVYFAAIAADQTTQTEFGRLQHGAAEDDFTGGGSRNYSPWIVDPVV